MVPKYRTVNDWFDEYSKMLMVRDVSCKTIGNRTSIINSLRTEFGRRTISSVKPHEIATYIKLVYLTSPSLAKRRLQVLKDIFNEAINYGWVLRNPAATVKQAPAPIRRKRLSFEQFSSAKEFSISNQPPWCSRMMNLAVVTGQRRSDLHKMKFTDVWDEHLHIEQQKTKTKLALPIDLRMNVLGLSIREIIEDCREYAVGDEFLLRKHNGDHPVPASMSARFEQAIENTLGQVKDGLPPSLHECRSLSERMYRVQGIDTKILLGHKHQSMTDMYNDDRGLTSGNWKTLKI
jgi:integrase